MEVYIRINFDFTFDDHSILGKNKKLFSVEKTLHLFIIKFFKQN